MIYKDFLIFLDIDGVMVPMKNWKKSNILDDKFTEFSSKSVDSLNKILTENTIIILTTSHRFNFSINEWLDIFKKRGLKISKMEISNYNGKNRKDEILKWFEENSCDNYIIIDDDKSLNDLPKEMKENLILTSPLIGLTKNLIK